MNTKTILAAVVLVGSLLGAGYFAPAALNFVDITWEVVFSHLGMVVLLTLFVERAQEVILTTWRAQSSEACELAILEAERHLANAKKDVEPEKAVAIAERLSQLRAQKLNHKARTRTLALRLGLAMGLLVSVVGVRVLAPLLEEGSLLALLPYQLTAFNAVDILLTGSVIAGGSDGVHKLAEFYRVFMENQSKRQVERVPAEL